MTKEEISRKGTVGGGVGTGSPGRGPLEQSRKELMVALGWNDCEWKKEKDRFETHRGGETDRKKEAALWLSHLPDWGMESFYSCHLLPVSTPVFSIPGVIAREILGLWNAVGQGHPLVSGVWPVKSAAERHCAGPGALPSACPHEWVTGHRPAPSSAALSLGRAHVCGWGTPPALFPKGSPGDQYKARCLKNAFLPAETVL